MKSAQRVSTIVVCAWLVAACIERRTTASADDERPRRVARRSPAARRPRPAASAETAARSATAASAPAAENELTILGTNDFHGRLDVAPMFAGYVANVRRTRGDARVVLLDAGDMFQGTLESNLLEGEPVVRFYDALGVRAAAIGNHEFDYGPVGPASVVVSPGDDPRGALRARAAQASFPFLAANLNERETHRIPPWRNVMPSVVLDVSGISVGVIGVVTEDALHTTIAANVTGLEVTPLASTIEREARALRERGARVIVVAAHAGGECHRFDDPRDLTSCDARDEIFRVAQALPAGLVDVIVAGHTHARVAHVVNGIAVIESHANGRAFGRVDLTLDASRTHVVSARLFAPQDICETPSPRCVYEGVEVVPDARVRELLAPAYERARALRARPLNVTLRVPIRRDYDAESALGNLFVDLMREASPGATVAITNGGALRANLPAGPLTYGALFEAMPFDNRFARVRLTGRELARLFAQNLANDNGVLSISGARVLASCDAGALRVRLVREDDTPIADDETVEVTTSDFLATGGDGVFRAAMSRPGAVRIDPAAETLRDGMAARLEARAGQVLEPGQFLDPQRPRLVYSGRRPVRCHAE